MIILALIAATVLGLIMMALFIGALYRKSISDELDRIDEEYPEA